VSQLSAFLQRYAIAVLFAVAVLSPTGQALAGWQLVWSDEFDGTNVDRGRWTFDIGNGRGGWGNKELQYYTSRPTNVFASNGLLHLVARRENYQGCSYTSTRLKTKGLFSALYGRFEFRVKLPHGKGYWPALWLMPQNSIYGGWPASGEVDIMESRGRTPTKVLGTLHFGGPYPNHAQSHGPAYTFAGGDSVTNFHVYALEWTTNRFSWYVDNTLYETQTTWQTPGGPYPAPFDQPFYIIMNLAVGGNFDGDPDGTTVFPGDMQVDYVRVYKWTTPATPGSS
jgi:beta-glucanase (GH16 family)